MQNFRALGAPPPHSRASGGWGQSPQTPNTAPHYEFLATRLATETMGSVSLFLIDPIQKGKYC